MWPATFPEMFLPAPPEREIINEVHEPALIISAVVFVLLALMLTVILAPGCTDDRTRKELFSVVNSRSLLLYIPRLLPVQRKNMKERQLET